VAQDFFSLRKNLFRQDVESTEGRNLLNPASHCDIAWAGGLATRSDSVSTWGGGRGPPHVEAESRNNLQGGGLPNTGSPRTAQVIQK